MKDRKVDKSTFHLSGEKGEILNCLPFTFLGRRVKRGIVYLPPFWRKVKGWNLYLSPFWRRWKVHCFTFHILGEMWIVKWSTFHLSRARWKMDLSTVQLSRGIWNVELSTLNLSGERLKRIIYLSPFWSKVNGRSVDLSSFWRKLNGDMFYPTMPTNLPINTNLPKTLGLAARLDPSQRENLTRLNSLCNTVRKH